MKIPKPTERETQRSILAELRGMGLRAVHIPNGAHMAGDSKQRARQWGAMIGDGAVKGFPDLLVMKRGGLVGFLEVKRPGGKAEPHQIACHEALAADGFHVAVVHSTEEALAAIREWGW
jgi:hypothetical protein